VRNQPLVTKEFPEVGYSRDDAAQALLDGRARWKRRQYIGCAIGVAVGTGLMVLGGYLNHDGVTVTGRGFFLIASAYALVLGVMHPKRACLSCGHEFEKRWKKGEGEMEDLFLVCGSCRKYVFAHEVRS
jgi:hypothetical protein